MKFEHEAFDFHGVFYLPLPARRYDDEFWKELLGEKVKKSKEQNLKELGF